MKKMQFIGYLLLFLVSSIVIGFCQSAFAADDQQGLAGTVTLIDGNGGKHIDQTMVLTMNPSNPASGSQFVGTIFIDDPNLPAPFNFNPPVPQKITGVFDGNTIIMTAFQTYIQGTIDIKAGIMTIDGFIQITNNSPVNTATGTFSLNYKLGD